MYKSKYLEKAKQRLGFKVDVRPGGDNMLRDADGKPVKAQYINSAQIYRSTFDVQNCTAGSSMTGMALRGYEK